MLKLFNKLSISRSIVISFAILIVLLISNAIFSQVVIRGSNNINRYNIEYVMHRRQLVSSFESAYDRFNRLLIRIKLHTDLGIETSPEILELDLNSASNAIAAMQRFAGEYINSVQQDGRMSDADKEKNIEIMHLIQHRIDEVYAELLIGAATNLYYLDEIAIYNNLHVVSQKIQTLNDYNQQDEQATQQNIYNLVSLYFTLMLLSVALSVALAVSAAFGITKSFNQRMSNIKDHVLKIKQGDISLLDSEKDEISIVVNDIINSISSIVEEIYHITEENEKGNIDVRIDVAKFEGIYKNAANGINKLMDVAKDVQISALRIASAEENSVAKSRFLARMSHEIRTPITAVLGIAEIQLQNKDNPLEIEEAFVKIYSSATTLLGIVTDVLDMSKIEAGKLEILEKKYHTADFIGDTIQMNLAYLNSKPVEFKVKVDSRLPSILKGDEIRLKQIVTNILSNAFKYTNEGVVILDMGCSTNETQGYINLDVSIKDTGVGMTEEQLDNLFGEYNRFHQKEMPHTSGTGLGMAITKSLVDNMHGTIHVESIVSFGTKVKVSIPQQILSIEVLGEISAEQIESFKAGAINLVSRSKIEPVSMPHATVLVVDDIEANLYVAKGILSLYDINVKTFTNGYDAIEDIKNGAEYDIIFMDQMMPELNGVDTTNALRKRGYTKPIIAFTANALVGQAEEYLKKGFDGFISKPIQTPHLHAILTKYIPVVPTTNENPVAYLENADMMKGVKEDFLKNHNNLYNEITKAIDKNDLETAKLKSHTLKTFAALLLHTKLEKLAYAIELELKEGNIPAPQLLDSLQELFNEMLESMKKA